MHPKCQFDKHSLPSKDSCPLLLYPSLIYVGPVVFSGGQIVLTSYMQHNMDPLHGCTKGLQAALTYSTPLLQLQLAIVQYVIWPIHAGAERYVLEAAKLVVLGDHYWIVVYDWKYHVLKSGSTKLVLPTYPNKAVQLLQISMG